MRGHKRRGKTVEIDTRSLIIFVSLVLGISLAIIGGVNIVKSFMTVSEFEITGYSPYEDEEILNVCGVRRGDKLYSVDAEAAAQSIIKKCPYIYEVKVETKFPDTLIFDVKSRIAAWYVELGGDFYALDSELFVLEETYNEQKFIDGKVTKLTLPHIKTAIVGETLTFGEGDSEIKFTNDLMRLINSTTFKSRITSADLSTRFEIRIVVDGKIDVYMGSFSDAETKLEAVERALGEEELSDCISAEIDVSDPSSIYVKPTYDYGEPK